MRALMLSTDPLLCESKSAVSRRIGAYAAELGAIDVLVLTPNTRALSWDENALSVYPAQSRLRIFSGVRAFFISRTLLRPHVVTVQDPFETGLLGLLISCWNRVPLHVQVHTDFLAPEFIAHSWKNRVRVWLAGLVLRRAARIRVVSARIKASIEETYKVKTPISILPIFVDTEHFRRVVHHPHERFSTSLLFVGRLESEKHADIAIHTLKRIRLLGVNAGLTIVGDGSLHSELEALVAQEGLGDWVVFSGRTDPSPHYAQADLVLVPSSYEGYGLVIIEALSAGVPVVATNVGIAEEAGAYIAPHDVDGFSGEVCSLLAHAQLPKGELRAYPYHNEHEYISAWVDDMRAIQSSL